MTTVQWWPSEQEAAAAELHAITTEHPKFNQQGVTRPFVPNLQRRIEDLTTPEVARFLGLSIEACRLLIPTIPGAYPTTRGPAAYRVPQPDLIALIRAQP